MIIQPVKNSDIEQLGLDSTDGVIIKTLDDNGPAAKAGLRKNDVITKFNGKKVRETMSFVRMVAATKPHTEVSIEIIRDGNKKTLNVKIGRRMQ